MDSRKFTPYPSPNFPQQCESVLAQSMCACVSGEFTADTLGAPLGVVKRACKIVDVFLSCEEAGIDDAASLSFTCDVYINGVSCLTTAPEIQYRSGEASIFKTTKISGEYTGTTPAEIDTDADELDPGDVITYDLVITRTSPDSEMVTPCIVVELEPV